MYCTDCMVILVRPFNANTVNTNMPKVYVNGSLQKPTTDATKYSTISY